MQHQITKLNQNTDHYLIQGAILIGFAIDCAMIQYLIMIYFDQPYNDGIVTINIVSWIITYLNFIILRTWHYWNENNRQLNFIDFANQHPWFQWLREWLWINIAFSIIIMLISPIIIIYF